MICNFKRIFVNLNLILIFFKAIKSFEIKDFKNPLNNTFEILNKAKNETNLSAEDSPSFTGNLKQLYKCIILFFLISYRFSFNLLKLLLTPYNIVNYFLLMFYPFY